MNIETLKQEKGTEDRYVKFFKRILQAALALACVVLAISY
ncbi:hypothetical protein Aazo_4145 ['Nostoc azollae' 0708]|jgi:hypothetical protein|uniref:Uncharacterized protein n=1 Tax=Nostoc azollae (strain 0708) TaxID=551115 RepID=D7DW08_NOSA0|nr:hypothetical protein Aazo_4145 ['Nostoc azollae' 0708]